MNFKVNERGFDKTLASTPWESVQRLVEDETGAAVYWYVESWDGLGRYAKTDVMSFGLQEEESEDAIRDHAGL